MHAIISYDNNSWTVYSGNQINIDPTGSSSVYLAVVSQDTSGNNWDYQIDVTDGELSIENASIPSSISVSQNFPNPFNPSTSFDVVLPYAQHLKIDISTHEYICLTIDLLIPLLNKNFSSDYSF